MLAIDPYLNETTRHADVILPPPPPARSAHFDVALNNLAVRNNVRYSLAGAAVWHGRPDEPEILSRLALILYGVGADGDPAPGRRAGDRDDAGARRPPIPIRRWRAARSRSSPRCCIGGPGYERRLDMMLRLGPYGDAFGAKPDGLTLERLKANPHGIDLGPLRPRLPEILRTPSRANRTRTGADRRRCGAAARGAGPHGGRVPADRPPPSAVQQQLDAQPARRCPAGPTGARCRFTPTTRLIWASPTSPWSRDRAVNCWPRSR